MNTVCLEDSIEVYSINSMDTMVLRSLHSRQTFVTKSFVLNGNWLTTSFNFENRDPKEPFDNRWRDLLAINENRVQWPPWSQREGKQWTESRHSVNTICKFHLIGVHLMIILMAILNQFFRFETLCFNETIIMTHRVWNTESLSVCELQTSIHLALSDWPVGPAECIIERYSMSSPVHSPGSWTYSDWYHKKLVGGWR